MSVKEKKKMVIFLSIFSSFFDFLKNNGHIIPFLVYIN
jgi:hypothetical protein